MLGAFEHTVDTLVKKKIRVLAVKEGIRLNGAQDLQARVMVAMFGLFAEIEILWKAAVRPRIGQSIPVVLRNTCIPRA